MHGDEERAARPGPAPSPAERRAEAAIERLTEALAMAGGLILTGVAAMTVASVAGRYLFGAPIPGDYEITELACGVAIFAFFPYCHLKDANIVVGFFAGGLPRRFRAALDAAHNLVFVAVAALIAWRLGVGAMHKLGDGETTVFLGIPVHWGYFPALAGAAWLTAVCAWTLRRRLRELAR